jgi:hypothetical protein
MEYSYLLKWGLLLETIGFIGASFFIALLRIKRVKRIYKKLISGFSWFSRNFTSTASIGNLIMIFKVLFPKRPTFSKITFPKGWKLRSISILGKEWRIDYKSRKIIWQYPILVILNLLFVSILIIFFVFSIIFILSLIIAHYMIFIEIIWISKKFSESVIVIKFMVVLGTITALAGLIMQLCSVW